MTAKAAEPKRGRGRPKKLHQEYIPGTQPEKNAKVHGLALAYADVRDERCVLSKQEKEAHDSLLFMMQEEGLETYTWGDLKVSINSSKKCVVKTKADQKEGDEDGDS